MHAHRLAAALMATLAISLPLQPGFAKDKEKTENTSTQTTAEGANRGKESENARADKASKKTADKPVKEKTEKASKQKAEKTSSKKASKEKSEKTKAVEKAKTEPVSQAEPTPAPAAAVEKKSTFDPSKPRLATTVEKKPAPWATLDARMVRIEHRIVDAVSSGRLSTKEAESLRHELDNVAEMEAIFRSMPANAVLWHNIALNQELDRITETLERSMRDRTVAEPDLVFAKQDSSMRIDTGVREGRLTNAEAAELRQEYNRILAMEHMIRQTKGKLSYSDRLALAIDFDHLSARIRRQMSEPQVTPADVDKVAAELEQRIAAAVQTGEMPIDAANNLKAQLQEVRETEKANRELKRNLERREVIAIGLWLEMISNRIDEAVARAKKTLPTPAALVTDLDKKIGVGLARGALTPLEALELKDDVDLLNAIIKKGFANNDEEAAFRLGVARLDGLIDRQVHASSRIWPGIRAYQAHQGTRIIEGETAARITPDEAKTLRAKADRIHTIIESVRGDQGYFASNALTVVIELQRLSADIDKALKDRSIDMPKLDQLEQALDRRLGDAAVSGDLNIEEAREHKIELDRILSMESGYRASDGVLSGRETLNVAYELQRLAQDVEEQVHDHSSLFPGLDLRRTQIEELINEGLASGRLGSAEGKAEMDAVNSNAQQEKAARASAAGLTGSEGIKLVSRLETQYDTLERTLRERQVSSADIISTVGSVERKIAHGAYLGFLSLADAERFRAQFDALMADMTRMRSQGGGLSYGERVAFTYGFTRLGAAVERQMRTIPLPLPNIDSRRAELVQKIADSLAAGRLPSQEAMDLKSLVDEIGRSQYRQRLSGGGLSYGEALVASVDLDRLSDRIDRRVKSQKTALPDIDARQSALERRLNEAHASGKISATQLQSFKADLDRIAESEVAFRTSQEGLNFPESVHLVLELEQLDRHLSEAIAKPPAPKTSVSPAPKPKTAVNR